MRGQRNVPEDELLQKNSLIEWVGQYEGLRFLFPMSGKFSDVSVRHKDAVGLDCCCASLLDLFVKKIAKFIPPHD